MTELTREDVEEALQDFEPTRDQLDLIVDCVWLGQLGRPFADTDKEDAIIGRIFRKHITDWFESNSGD